MTSQSEIGAMVVVHEDDEDGTTRFYEGKITAVASSNNGESAYRVDAPGLCSRRVGHEDILWVQDEAIETSIAS